MTELESLRKQLAEKDAEIDRLRARFNTTKNPGCDATCLNYCLHADHEWKQELESALADSQAREAGLRDALEFISYKEADDGDWLLMENVMLNVSHKGPLVKQNIKKQCRKIRQALSTTNPPAILAVVEAAELAQMTLKHAQALDYLGEGSTKGMADDAIQRLGSALAALKKERE